MHCCRHLLLFHTRNCVRHHVYHLQHLHQFCNMIVYIFSEESEAQKVHIDEKGKDRDLWSRFVYLDFLSWLF
jgi:hypothetical protein